MLFDAVRNSNTKSERHKCNSYQSTEGEKLKCIIPTFLYVLAYRNKIIQKKIQNFLNYLRSEKKFFREYQILK
jgi:hypothetical protein